MPKLDDRTLATLDFVLEAACNVFPHCGNHERHRYIARKLKISAKSGNITLAGLRAVAQSALKEILQRPA